MNHPGSGGEAEPSAPERRARRRADAFQLEPKERESQTDPVSSPERIPDVVQDLVDPRYNSIWSGGNFCPILHRLTSTR